MKLNLHRSALILLFALASIMATSAGAQRPAFGGPAKVVVDNVREGVLTPRQRFPATVFFKQVSDVATEISGKVIEVTFEEVDRVKKGQLLMRVDSALLLDELRASKANLKRFQTALRESQVLYDRATALLEGGVSAQEQFDAARFAVESNAYQIDSTQANVDRIQTTIGKYSIYAPFDGVVIDRDTEVGEWRSDGDMVAVIAREDEFDVLANVSEEYLPWLRTGETVPIRLISGDRRIEGKIVTVIRRGDIESRTFPVKIRVIGQRGLFEGMSAIADLPAGEETPCILVPRDAVLNQAGRDFLFSVEEGIAVEHTVTVLGYDGLFAGVTPGQIDLDYPVITKGHERLRSGAKVEVVGQGTFKVRVQHGGD